MAKPFWHCRRQPWFPKSCRRSSLPLALRAAVFIIIARGQPKHRVNHANSCRVFTLEKGIFRTSHVRWKSHDFSVARGSRSQAPCKSCKFTLWVNIGKRDFPNITRAVNKISWFSLAGTQSSFDCIGDHWASNGLLWSNVKLGIILFQQHRTNFCVLFRARYF